MFLLGCRCGETGERLPRRSLRRRRVECSSFAFATARQVSACHAEAFGVGGLGVFLNRCRHLSLSNFLTTIAGFPATITFGGTLLVTTDPAATTEFSPMLTPFKIVAFIPIQTLSAII